MKARINLKSSLVVALATLFAVSFTACSSDSDPVGNDASTTIQGSKDVDKTPSDATFFSLKLQAMSDGSDVTTKGQLSDVTLFVFDDNNEFIETIAVEKAAILNRRPIEIPYSGSDRITVIAWGGLKNVDVPAMNMSNLISDLTVSLKQNNGIAHIPGDIFFGQTTLTRPTKADAAATMSVVRKVSSVDLLVTGVADKFGTTEGDFYFKVKSSQSVYTSAGELSGETVEYIIPAYVNAAGNVTVDKSSIFPTSEVEIELYRDDEIVFSISKDKNGKNLSAAAGKQLSICYDLARTYYAVHVASWGTVVQYV